METLRFASPTLATQYPLRVAGTVDWLPTTTGWRAEVALPELPQDHIVVPSLALYDSPAPRTFALTHEALSWQLCPYAAQTSNDATNAAVTTHIDYFHVRSTLPGATLTVTVAAERPPRDYLLVVSMRAFRCAPAAGSTTANRIVVPALSQLTAPRAIRRRICSPACVTMTLAYHGRAATLAQVVAACFHAPSQLYGVWPLAVDCLAVHGIAAAAECFTDLDAPSTLLGAGLPVIASIRFDAGALPGAPLPATDGHLVVVTGIDRNWVHVNDPAARDAAEVPRSYPREAFATAWLCQRGVAYVASPLQ
jgi:Peptidase_C39 like family